MASGTSRAPLVAGCFIGLALAACARQGPDEMSWARAALERNSALKIEAADAQARTFTVRMKDTGELRVLRLDELVGGPSPEVAAAANAPAAQAAAAPAPAASEPAAAAAGEVAREPAEPPTSPPPAATPVFASKALHAGSPAPPVPGQVLEAGPGYTIEAGSAAATAASAREAGPAGAVERRHDPIVCQGARLLHIDNQNLQFDGDGLSAEDGCEIHITNSRIRATGVGVSARAANVHIDNSLIEGDAASIDASEGAQIYTASSKFRGLSRQLDTATVHDLGGNVWN
ncbi:MAG: hypothetical protein ACLPQ6_08480 [Steroidobacteraceae bacterium]|jgi:hypothetical protein